MHKRIIYGISISCTVLLLLLLDYLTGSVYFLSGLVVSASVIAWCEFSKMAIPGKKSFMFSGAVAIGGFGSAVWLLGSSNIQILCALRSVGIPAVIFVFLLWKSLRWKEGEALLADSTLWIAGFLYLGYLPSYLLQLRYLENGSGLILFLLLVIKFGDSGAYFTGKFLGRHKLCRVSPNKTIEGALGGFLTSIIIAVLAYWIVLDGDYWNLGRVVCVAAALSVAGQLGDLIESFLKRSCTIKDSASIIPELGGILDMADSVLFAAPVMYFFVVWYKSGNFY